MRRVAPISLLLAAFACGEAEPGPNACRDEGTEGATAACLEPTLPPEHYVEQALLYFDTLDVDAPIENVPDYHPLVARWEWPPWLLLTGFGAEDMIDTGLSLRELDPSTVPERDCRFFETQPFARCYVVFEYEEGPCPIYEEFTFDAEGRVIRLGTILKQGWFAPMMCLVVMLPSAALNLAASWRATRKWKRQQMPPRWRYEVGQWARALEFIGYFALYTLAVPVLGYLLSTMILLPFLTFRLGYRSWYWLRVSGLVAFAIVLLFRTALQIKTPVNIWLYNQLPDAVGIFMKTWF